ncbi:3-oxoacyl-ACP reductase [Spirochaetia bacterium]|nr:3-oxoacyl-ACP reductase [Spirochaetia bacterium]
MSSYNPFSLDGKTILVTGASSGIGRATAIECSKMGAKLIITGRNTDRLNETFIQLDGTDHIQITANLQDTAQLSSLIDSIPEITGVVHCAGITKTVPFQFASRENLDTVMNINFYAPVELTRLLLKKKKLAGNGSIVFISSISGVICSAPASSIYSASKGGINGLVKGMALDLAPKGIRVNCINPGVIETAIFEAEVISKEQIEEDKKRYPLNRHGKPKEVAYAAIYLLSDASAWVTGSNLVIDGGFTLL